MPSVVTEWNRHCGSTLGSVMALFNSSLFPFLSFLVSWMCRPCSDCELNNIVFLCLLKKQLMLIWLFFLTFKVHLHFGCLILTLFGICQFKNAVTFGGKNLPNWHQRFLLAMQNETCDCYLLCVCILCKKKTQKNNGCGISLHTNSRTRLLS